MPAYKLSYFSIRALGEVPRQLLHLGGADWEDDRIERENWPDRKAGTPFGQLPVLTEDGKELAQSGAITRYLAKKFGFAGKDDWETAQVDALYEQARDFLQSVRPAIVVLAGFAEGDKDKVITETALPARDKLAPLLEKYLAANKSGFLVGDGLTYADLFVAEILTTWKGFVPDFTKGYPALDELVSRVHKHPKLADWIEKRPETKF